MTDPTNQTHVGSASLDPTYTRPFPAHHQQRGIALITAMLVVALATTTAAYMSLDQEIWLRQAQTFNERAQAEAVRQAALSWAAEILEQDGKDSKIDTLEEDWAKDLPPIPVEGGLVTGKIEDAQGRFNLNGTLRNGSPSVEDIGVFRRLLEAQGLDAELADALLDWLDADAKTRPRGAEDIAYLSIPPPQKPYRAANQLLHSVDELRLIQGFTAEVVDRLRGTVTALPKPMPINVNTANEQVLRALFYGLTDSAVQELIEDRPYKNVNQLTRKISQLTQGKDLKTAAYGLKSEYFLVTVSTEFGRFQRSSRALLHRVSRGSAGLLWHAQWLPIEEKKEDRGEEK